MVWRSGRSRRARPAMPDTAPNRPLRFLDAVPQVQPSGSELPVRVPVRDRQLAGARFISVCVSDVDVSSGAWHRRQRAAAAPSRRSIRVPPWPRRHGVVCGGFGPCCYHGLAAIARGSWSWRIRLASAGVHDHASRSRPLLGGAARSSLSGAPGRAHRPPAQASLVDGARVAAASEPRPFLAVWCWWRLLVPSARLLWRPSGWLRSPAVLLAGRKAWSRLLRDVQPSACL